MNVTGRMETNLQTVHLFERTFQIHCHIVMLTKTCSYRPKTIYNGIFFSEQWHKTKQTTKLQPNLLPKSSIH